MRAIVNRGFTPRQIAALEPRVREVVEECMAPLRRGEPFDVMADLAARFPVTMIAEMLGVPPEQHRDFKRWSDYIISMATGPEREQRAPARAACEPVLELIVTMKKLARERRAHPRDDLISTILAEQDGAMALTDREVVQFVLLLLVAGNETTTNLIGNLTHALLEHPEQLRAVAADPGPVPALVEEGLRFDSPVQVVFRTATRGHRDPRHADSEGPVRGGVPGLGESRRAPLPRPRPARLDRDARASRASASASTSASARRSRGSRRASRSRRSCPSCPGSSARTDDRARRLLPRARAQAARRAARRVGPT